MEHQAQLVHKDLSEPQDCQVHQEFVESQDIQDDLDVMEFQELQEPLDQQAKMAKSDQKVWLDLEDQEDLSVNQEQWDLMEKMVAQEHLEKLVHLE